MSIDFTLCYAVSCRMQAKFKKDTWEASAAVAAASGPSSHHCSTANRSLHAEAVVQIKVYRKPAMPRWPLLQS